MFLSLMFGACGASRTADDAGQIEPDAHHDDAAAAIDADGDGVARDVDCDDADAAVGRLGTRACSNECGSGDEACTDGRWSACSAPTDCRCTTPGETEIRPCGNCGTQSAACTDGHWQPISACFDEGECTVAAVETRATRRCGTQQRLCNGTCEWSEWMQVEPDGECAPDDLRRCPDGTARGNICNDACQWEEECR